jgi:hypothetical protein
VPEKVGTVDVIKLFELQLKISTLGIEFIDRLVPSTTAFVHHMLLAGSISLVIYHQLVEPFSKRMTFIESSV